MKELRDFTGRGSVYTVTQQNLAHITRRKTTPRDVHLVVQKHPDSIHDRLGRFGMLNTVHGTPRCRSPFDGLPPRAALPPYRHDEHNDGVDQRRHECHSHDPAPVGSNGSGNTAWRHRNRRRHQIVTEGKTGTCRVGGHTENRIGIELRGGIHTQGNGGCMNSFVPTSHGVVKREFKRWHFNGTTHNRSHFVCVTHTDIRFVAPNIAVLPEARRHIEIIEEFWLAHIGKRQIPFDFERQRQRISLATRLCIERDEGFQSRTQRANKRLWSPVFGWRSDFDL